MKLRLYTQVYENYAAHDEFTGEYRWKPKGGSTYVVRDLTPLEALQATKEGALKDRLVERLESRSVYFEEYVIGWDLLDDSEPESEEWEIPYIKVVTEEDGEFVFTQNSKLLKEAS